MRDSNLPGKTFSHTAHTQAVVIDDKNYMGNSLVGRALLLPLFMSMDKHIKISQRPQVAGRRSELFFSITLKVVYSSTEILRVNDFE